MQLLSWISTWFLIPLCSTAWGHCFSSVRFPRVLTLLSPLPPPHLVVETWTWTCLPSAKHYTPLTERVWGGLRPLTMPLLNHFTAGYSLIGLGWNPKGHWSNQSFFSSLKQLYKETHRLWVQGFLCKALLAGKAETAWIYFVGMVVLMSSWFQ